MKKILIVVVIAFFAFSACLFSLPRLVNVDQFVAHLSDFISKKTGRSLVVNGGFSLHVFPEIALRLNNVSLSSPAGLEPEAFFSAQELRLKLGIIPLLMGRTYISDVYMLNPVFDLAVLEDGSKNWDFSYMASEDISEIPEEELGIDTFDNKEKKVFDELVFSSLVIQGATIHYTDQMRLVRVDISDVNVDTSFVPGKNPFLITGKIDHFLSELGSFSLQGEYETKGDSLNIDELAVAIDNLQSQGAVNINFQDVIPVVEASLSFNDIDVSQYFTNISKRFEIDVPDSKDVIASEKAADLNVAYNDDQWSTKPFDFEWLHFANMHLGLKLDGLHYADFDIGSTTAYFHLLHGKLSFDIEEMRLYDGQAIGRVALDITTGVPLFFANMSFDSIALDSLFLPVSSYVEGDFTGELDINSSGFSEKDFIDNLDGKTAISLLEGNIKNLDFFSFFSARRASTIDSEKDFSDQTFNYADYLSTIFAPGEQLSENFTRFDSLKGSFIINKGVVANNDLLLEAKNLLLHGKGEVNLPSRFIDYTLTPEVHMGKVSMAGLTVPVIIRGDLDRPMFIPDVSSMSDVSGDAETKQDIGSLVGKVKKNISIIGNSLFGKKEEEQTGNAEKNDDVSNNQVGKDVFPVSPDSNPVVQQ